MAFGSGGFANPGAAEHHDGVRDSAFSEQELGFLIIKSEADVPRVRAAKEVNVVVGLTITGAVEDRLNCDGRVRVLGRRFRFLRG